MPDALVERDGHTMVITMNRPQALQRAHRSDARPGCTTAMVEACADDDIRSIILTGAEGNFCSGADLRAMAGDAEDTDSEIDVAARMAEDPDLACKGLLRHYQPTKPLIAAVEGVAIAGGTELLQGTDIRVAGESAPLRRERGALVALPDGRFGRPPAPPDPLHARGGDPAHRASTSPPRKRRASASSATSCPTARRSPRRSRSPSTINNNGPLAVEAILRTLRETDGMTEQEALAHEFEYGQAVFATEDAKEGPKAFAEKRTPNFQRKYAPHRRLRRRSVQNARSRDACLGGRAGGSDVGDGRRRRLRSWHG